MKRIAQQSALFGACLIVFYAVNVWVINRLYISGKRAACWVNPQFSAVGGQDFQVTHQWDSSAFYDVVVAGSSHAYRGYDPRIFAQHGLHLFTIGTGYQNALASYVLLKNDCRLKPGSLLIVDLYDNTFTGDGMGCFSRLIPNAASETTAREFLLRVPDLRLMNAYFCYLATDQGTIETQLKEGYVFNGYSQNLDSAKKTLDTTAVADEVYSFRGEYLEYLNRIIDLAQSQQCRVVLVSHPVPMSPRNLAFHQAFRAYLEPLIKQKEVRYLDFSAHNEFDPANHFMDANHLNQAGVDQYNAILLDTLASLQLISKKS